MYARNSILEGSHCRRFPRNILTTILFRISYERRKCTTEQQLQVLAAFSELFYDGGRYPIETGKLICRANQWTGFYMITPSVMKELRCSCYHTRVIFYYKKWEKQELLWAIHGLF